MASFFDPIADAAGALDDQQDSIEKRAAEVKAREDAIAAVEEQIEKDREERESEQRKLSDQSTLIPSTGQPDDPKSVADKTKSDDDDCSTDQDSHLTIVEQIDLAIQESKDVIARVTGRIEKDGEERESEKCKVSNSSTTDSSSEQPDNSKSGNDRTKSDDDDCSTDQDSHLTTEEKASLALQQSKLERNGRLMNVIKTSGLHDLTCPLCLDWFAKPRILPCGHTFCADCIKEWPERNCPVCRSVLPETTQEFPPNYLIISLVDSVKPIFDDE